MFPKTSLVALAALSMAGAVLGQAASSSSSSSAAAASSSSSSASAASASSASSSSVSAASASSASAASSSSSVSVVSASSASSASSSSVSSASASSASVASSSSVSSTSASSSSSSASSAASSPVSSTGVKCGDGSAPTAQRQDGSKLYGFCANTSYQASRKAKRQAISATVPTGSDPNVYCTQYCSSVAGCVAVTYSNDPNVTPKVCTALFSTAVPIVLQGTNALVVLASGLTPVQTTSLSGAVSTFAVGTDGGVGIMMGGSVNNINNSNNTTSNVIGSNNGNINVNGNGNGIAQGSDNAIAVGTNIGFANNGGVNGGSVATDYAGPQAVYTVYSLSTITSCAATVTDCPALPSVKVISLYTTTCPAGETTYGGSSFTPVAYIASVATTTVTQACPVCPGGSSTSVGSTVTVVPASSGQVPGATASAVAASGQSAAAPPQAAAQAGAQAAAAENKSVAAPAAAAQVAAGSASALKIGGSVVGLLASLISLLA